MEGSSTALPRRILCATDFGPTGARACAVAADLARRLDAELLLLHVFEGEGALPWLGRVTEGVLESLLGTSLSGLSGVEELREKVEADLRHARRSLSDLREELDRTPAEPEGEGRVKAKVVEGASIWRAILDHAALEDADLIVLGPHDVLEEEGLADRLAVRLLGSTAERVVAHADVPVLVAIAPLPPAGGAAGHPAEPWPAVIGHDFSAHSDHALAYASALLPALGARALLAHALPGFFDARDEGEAFGRLSPELRADLERELRARLARAELEGEAVVLSGKAAGALSRLAIKRSAGLLVVASLGASVPLGALPQALLGSTASGCLRQSSTSVLVVREPDEEERARRKESASTPTLAEKEWAFVR